MYLGPRGSDECLPLVIGVLEKIPFHVCPYITESQGSLGLISVPPMKITATTSLRQQVDATN